MLYLLLQDIDTSATESENETKQFADKQKQRKKKLEKKDLPVAKLPGGNKKQKRLDRDGKRKQGSRKVGCTIGLKRVQKHLLTYANSTQEKILLKHSSMHKLPNFLNK